MDVMTSWFMPTAAERDWLTLDNRPDAGPSEWFLGVDLGQMNDPTAVAVVERRQVLLGQDAATRGWWKAQEYCVRQLARLPLGTGYSEVAEQVAAWVELLRIVADERQALAGCDGG